MGQPVVHFEIIGGNPAELRAYYAELFGWTFRENSPVAPEVSRTDSYSFIDRMTTDDGTGIPGGVGGGSTFRSHAIFYVGVPDVEAALRKAEGLGGTRVMGLLATTAAGWSWVTSPTPRATWSVSPGPRDGTPGTLPAGPPSESHVERPWPGANDSPF
jgi:uncharacterized protein